MDDGPLVPLVVDQDDQLHDVGRPVRAKDQPAALGQVDLPLFLMIQVALRGARATFTPNRCGGNGSRQFYARSPLGDFRARRWTTTSNTIGLNTKPMWSAGT